MRQQDGITIAIPNWNHELLLPRAIRSALRALEILRNQGVDGEVLVIDDCSRDGSQVLLRQLEARYYRDGLRVVMLANNAGLTAVRNQALTRSRFRYLLFLDADNEVVPENLPVFLAALRQTRAAGAYGTLLIRTVASVDAIAAFSHESFQDRMFDNNYIDACAVFDRAQLVELGGYVNNRWEDYEVWLRLAAAGRLIVFVPIVLGYYYIVPASLTIDPNENHHLHAVAQRIKRVFNQVDARADLPLATRHRRYHPALGYF